MLKRSSAGSLRKPLVLQPATIKSWGRNLSYRLTDSNNNDQVDDEVFRQAYLTRDALPGDRLPGGEDAAADVRVESRRKKQQTVRNESTLCRIFEIPPQRFASLRQDKGLLRNEDVKEVATSLVSYLVGVNFGRWDIRNALDPSRRPALS